MFALTLFILVAAPPSAERAREWASKGAWESLYLGFATAQPTAYAPADRKVVAAALRKGCHSLRAEDPVMAFSLGERSVAFEESATGLLCVAASAQASAHRTAAEQALRQGLKRFPNNGAFGLRLGQLLLEESDVAEAARALAQVKRRTPHYQEAQRLLAHARALHRQAARDFKQTRAVEHAMAQAPPSSAGSLTYESSVGPGGMRTRANSRFRFRYFSGERDFGQRAEYEGKVAGALDDAYSFTRQLLGRAREAPVDVILYTREEFALHHGTGMSSAIAGFYSAGAIRINDASEINRHQVGTLVHEYVHAAVDEFAGGGRGDRVPVWLNEGLAEYVQWRFLGRDEPTANLRAALSSAAAANRLPPLRSLGVGRSFAGQPNVHVLYALSAMGIRQLLKMGGPENLLALLAEVGRGQPFESSFTRRYGRSLEEFDSELRQALSGD